MRKKFFILFLLTVSMCFSETIFRGTTGDFLGDYADCEYSTDYCTSRTSEEPLNGSVILYFSNSEGFEFVEYKGSYLNGRKNGKWTEYNIFGREKYIDNYKEGVENGESFSYYDSGKLSSQSYMKDGEVQSLTSYYTNGKIEEKYKNQNGIKETIKYDKDGTLVSEEKISKLDKGEKTEYIKYYTSGLIYEKSTYVTYGNDELERDTVRYYENGKILYLENHINRKGEITEYYEDGDIEKKIVFENVEPFGSYRHFTGKETSYFEDNKIKEVKEYKEGKLHGEYIIYNEDGYIVKKIEYANGRRNGGFSEYNDLGIIQSKTIYDDDVFKETIEYNDEGIEVGEAKKIEDDRKREEEIAKNGKERVEYYKNGNISYKGMFLNGKKEGEHKIYYKNGQLKEKGFYVDGQLDKEHIKYNEKGIITSDNFFERGYQYKQIKYNKEGKKEYEKYHDKIFKEGENVYAFEINYDKDGNPTEPKKLYGIEAQFDNYEDNIALDILGGVVKGVFDLFF